MLVLTCKDESKVKIGGKIIITILESSRGRTKLGIDASKEIVISRIPASERRNEQTYRG